MTTIKLRDVTIYNTPTSHPYSMLEGYKNAFEQESTLAWMLIKCIEAGKFIPIKLNKPFDMIQAGLVKEVDGGCYELTDKALRILWAEYGKSD